MENKTIFFQNCAKWLMPGGYLVVHVVNKNTFDPILPPGDPLFIVSPQKYAEKRITTTKIKFNNFSYASDFQGGNGNDNPNICTFVEKFQFNNGTTRKNEHTLYMDSLDDIVAMAQQSGLSLHKVFDMVECAYGGQYMYVFTA
jgi:hypothetical protein